MVSKKAVVVLVVIALLLSLISVIIFVIDSGAKNVSAQGIDVEKTNDSGQAQIGLVIEKPAEVVGVGAGK